MKVIRADYLQWGAKLWRGVLIREDVQGAEWWLTSSRWSAPTVLKIQPKVTPPPCNTCAFWAAHSLCYSVKLYLSLSFKVRALSHSPLYIQNLYLVGIYWMWEGAPGVWEVRRKRRGEVMKKYFWLMPVIPVGEWRWSDRSVGPTYWQIWRSG